MRKGTVPSRRGAHVLGIALAAATATSLATRPVEGGSATGTLDSSVTIVLTCLMSTTNVAFGGFVRTQSVSLPAPTTPGSVTIDCGSSGVALSVHLDASGVISSCAVPGAEHKMLNGAASLCYRLTMTSPAGGPATTLVNATNTVAYTTTVATANGAVFTLGGSIPGNQSATATQQGLYSDTVPLAVDY